LDSKTLTVAKREGKGLAFSITLKVDSSLIKTLERLSGKREKICWKKEYDLLLA